MIKAQPFLTLKIRILKNSIFSNKLYHILSVPIAFTPKYILKKQFTTNIIIIILLNFASIVGAQMGLILEIKNAKKSRDTATFNKPFKILTMKMSRKR